MVSQEHPTVSRAFQAFLVPYDNSIFYYLFIIIFFVMSLSFCSTVFQEVSRRISSQPAHTFKKKKAGHFSASVLSCLEILNIYSEAVLSLIEKAVSVRV